VGGNPSTTQKTQTTGGDVSEPVSLEALGLVESSSASTPVAQMLREVVALEDVDLAALVESGPSHSQPTIQHIRAIHHVVALRLAVGERPIEIARALSLTPQTITKLQKDPQFCELVESYQEKVVEKAIDQVELMSAAAAEATTSILERLSSDEQRLSLPLDQLLKIALGFADRTGHSPVRRSENTNRHEHAMSAETIARLKELHGEDIHYDRDAAVDVEFTASDEGPAVQSSEESAAGVVALFEPASQEEIDGAATAGEGLRESGDQASEERVSEAPSAGAVCVPESAGN
jgi:hypothetical protein